MTRPRLDAPDVLTDGDWLVGPAGVLVWVPDAENPLINKGSEGDVTAEACDNGGRNKTAPGGAQTPSSQGLTDYEGVG